MKAESEVGRYWFSCTLMAASRRVWKGRDLRWEIFSAQGRVLGMCRAERSWSNCSWAEAGDLGCTAAALDQMQACLIIAWEAGNWRS